MDIRVCAPSLGRGNRLETQEYLPFIKVYIDKKEEEAYRSNYPEVNFAICDDGIQGNICRVRNHILKKEFEGGADVVVIVDDDMKGVYRFNPESFVAELVKTEDFLSFVYKYSLLAGEWGARLWGIQINKDPQCFREYHPFSTRSYVGSLFQAFLKGNECWYDERLSLKEDYDMSLQQANKYRIILRVNGYFYNVRQGEQIGGCANYRNYEEEEKQFGLLKRKWGNSIVKADRGVQNHRKSKEKRFMDYNPNIHIPIKGI